MKQWRYLLPIIIGALFAACNFLSQFTRPPVYENGVFYSARAWEFVGKYPLYLFDFVICAFPLLLLFAAANWIVEKSKQSSQTNTALLQVAAPEQSWMRRHPDLTLGLFVTASVILLLCLVPAIMLSIGFVDGLANGSSVQRAPAAPPTYSPPTLPAPVYAPPTLTVPTPEPVKAWVCVDLAYGYAKPDTNSPVVFQMSQRDGWSVWVYELRGKWYTVGNGNMPAYMEYETLCKDQPQWNSTDLDAQREAIDALQKMLERNHGQ